MRILFELPYAELGGTEKHLLTLIRALGNDIKPCLIAPHGKCLSLFHDLGVPYEAIPPLAFKTGLRDSVRLHHEAFNRLSKKSGFSLIHVHAGIEYVVAASLASREFRRMPIVFTAHGYPSAASYLISGVLANRLADEIICVSDAERKKAAQYGWSKTKLSTIHNGVPDPSLAGLPGQVRTDWNIPATTCVIGTVVRLERVKGIDYLISAMPKVISKYPDTVLIIVGDGSKRSELTFLSQKLGIAKNIIFTGQLEDPGPLFSMMDVFVLPSLVDAFPLAVLEAMAFSLPVVTTEVGGIPEAVIHNKTGILVPPCNSEAIACALLELAKNQTIRKAHGTAGRKRFEEHFTDSAMAHRTLAVYQRTLARSQKMSGMCHA